MKNKLVSVIVSAYNSEETLEESINSLINQTYENIEILIMDDFSTDKSNIILKNIEKKSKKVKLFENNKNIGLTLSLNKLIKLSNGELIARHDCDDYSDPQRISKQVSFLEERNLDACTSRAIVKDTNKGWKQLYKDKYLKGNVNYGDSFEGTVTRNYLDNMQFFLN